MSISPDHTPGPVQLRVSDDEREAQAQLLRRHAAEGRLTLEELEERLELAYAARTQDELAALLRDLPPTATMALPWSASSVMSATSWRRSSSSTSC